jgi:hypothetical protein
VPLVAFLLLAIAIASAGVFAFEQYRTGARNDDPKRLLEVVKKVIG